MPVTIGESEACKEMIHAANKCVQVPSYKTTIDILHDKRHESSLKLKKYLQGKYSSTNIDHWTSLANENCGAITCHLIDDGFKLKARVLCCMKHENGSSAREMEQQLTKDLRSFFVCSMTDTAPNMNLFGEYLDGWENAPALRSMYCADHVLQLTAHLAYSGNIAIPDNDDDAENASAVRKARNLVSHLNSSHVAGDKFRSIQKKKLN
jgi:hypothetical protein